MRKEAFSYFLSSSRVRFLHAPPFDSYIYYIFLVHLLLHLNML